MAKKNYLGPSEQELWEFLQEKEIIDTSLVQEIFPDWPKNKIAKVLHRLFRKGYFQRARKNLYFSPKNIKDFYSLGLRIHEGYLGLNSALKFRHLLDYEDFTIFILTKNFQKKIDLKGAQYSLQFIPLQEYFAGFEKIGNFYVSSLEKTFFDCFLKPGLVGYSNLTKALSESKLDWNKFLDYFKLKENRSLCQRTGYILDLMKKEAKFKVPLFVFEYLSKKVKNPVKLAFFGGESKFNKKWKIQDNLGIKNIFSWRY